MTKKTLKEEPERKLIMETESFRVWEGNSADKQEETQKVEYKGQEFHLTGFSVVKKEGKIIFAYKFKHEARAILYFVPEELGEEKEKIAECLDFLRFSALDLGYEFLDMKTYFENISMQNIEGFVKQSKE